MKTPWLWACGLVVVAALVAATASWTLSSSPMYEQVAAQLRATSGLSVEVGGRTVFALLPRPRIKIENVVIRDRDGHLTLRSDVLRGDLRVLPLLTGRLQLSSVTLATPHIDVDLDHLRVADEVLARARRTGPDTAPPGSGRLGLIVLSNATLRMVSAARGWDVRVSQLNATLDWRSFAASAGVKGTLRWGDQPFAFTSWVGDPPALVSGRETPASALVESPLGNFRFNGKVTGGDAPGFSGDLTAATPDLQQIVTAATGVLSAVKSARVATNVQTTARAVTFDALKLIVNGDTYEGTLALDRTANPPSLSGTLATANADLSPVLDRLPPLLNGAGQWSGARVNLLPIAPVNLDLRLSAVRARLGNATLQDVGVSLMAGEARASLEIAEARAFGGSLRARLDAQRADAGYALSLSAGSAQMDAAALLSDLWRSQRVSGQFSGDLAVKAEGDTLSAIMRSLRGNATLAVAGGDMIGVDLEQALRRLEKRPLSIASEFRSGRTSFDTLKAVFAIDQGQATIASALLDGPGVTLGVRGAIAIRDRTLDLAMLAAQKGPQPQAPGVIPQLLMNLRGGWDKPAFTLDARSVILRSQAAAPLWGPQSAADPAPASPP